MKIVNNTSHGAGNEETYSGYAEGVRVKKYPSRRQEQFNKWVPDKDFLGSTLRYERTQQQINRLFNGKRYTLSH